MREGTLEAALLGGHKDLEVVGESYRQANLWRVVGGRHRPEVHVRMNVCAMLLAEDGPRTATPTIPTPFRSGSTA
jgi:hypothetical protein